MAGDALTLFASWAAARSALVAVERGRLAEAAPLVARALAVGPPLGHYEARLAQVELAAARDAAGRRELAAAALAAAVQAGYSALVPRLRILSTSPPGG